MVVNINYQIWFKVCRPFRSKYKLSTNCLMVLNGCFIYCRKVNNNFTRRKLLDFCSYYDNRRIGKYITVLMSHGFIKESGVWRGRQLYCISELGLTVIEELNKNYQVELNKFSSLYGL